MGSNLIIFGPKSFYQAVIEAEQVILKMDIEGYECKALPKEIILGSSGKWIPFIFIEWSWLVSLSVLKYIIIWWDSSGMFLPDPGVPGNRIVL